MGHISFVGKLDRDALRAGAPAIAPGFTLEIMANHSLDFWLTSEDLPDPNNRVTLDRDGNIVLSYRPNNEEGHKQMIAAAEISHGPTASLRTSTATNVTRVSSRATSTSANVSRWPASRTRTARFASDDDPKTSALDVNCRAHEVDNLYVVDGSFFPSSGAVNPALTIMANALRVGDHIAGRIQ